MLVLSVILGVVQAQTYSYFYQGLDWDGQCVTSATQSPVDLNNVQLRDQSNSNLQPLGISYSKAAAKLVSDSVSYRLLGAFGSLVTVDYRAAAREVAFHTPSEHLVNGEAADLEMQIYHEVQGSDGVAALAVLFVEGSYNAALGTLINSPAEVDLSLLFSGAKLVRNYYAYKGSLTVPNCESVVAWYVVATQMTASKDQLDYFRNKWENNINFAGGNGNNRLPQSLNNREVAYFQSNGAGLLLLSLYLSF